MATLGNFYVLTNKSIPRFKAGNVEPNDEEMFPSDLNVLGGVIKPEDEIKMKRMIFRTSRGRAISEYFNIKIVSIVINNIFTIEKKRFKR